MLFSYRFVPHAMDRLQKYLDFIFLTLWYEADANVAYDVSLLAPLPELQAIVTDFHYSDTKGGDLFNRTLEEVYAIFQTLTQTQRDQLKAWYLANNDIERLCANDPTVTPVNYDALHVSFPELAKRFKPFYKSMYGNTIISLAPIKNRVGEINEHYNSFMQHNDEGKCPFCGLSDLKGAHQRAREAYDHFIPKGTYPFNTINFKNLAPMCNTYNSSYKLEHDPLHGKAGNRRRAFYPYASAQPNIAVHIDFQTSDIETLKAEEVEISFEAAGHEQELEAWQELFNIVERYQEKCTAKSGGKYWFTQIMGEAADFGMTPQEFLRLKMKQMQKSPFADDNFLRKAFLEACERMGLLNA